jgi:galactoside O-acetyltransferase
VINEGVAVGAMSLINKDLAEWGIFTGIPANYLKARSKQLLKFIPPF